MTLLAGTDNAVANYETGDVEEGRTYDTYYLSAVIDAAATTYRLDKQKIHSSWKRQQILQNDPAEWDQDFDSDATNKPRIAEGRAYIPFSFSHKNSVSGTFQVFLKLYHLRVAVETQLGSTWSSEITTSTGAVVKRTVTAVIDVQNIQFAIGDKVRLNITTDKAGAQVGQYYDIGCSPHNLDSENGANGLEPETYQEDRTDMHIKMPFLIDV
jgi:hypothetical protein